MQIFVRLHCPSDKGSVLCNQSAETSKHGGCRGFTRDCERRLRLRTLTTAQPLAGCVHFTGPSILRRGLLEGDKQREVLLALQTTYLHDLTSMHVERSKAAIHATLKPCCT